MIALFKILACLPLGLARLLGLMLGWMIWALSARYRAMMNRAWNLAIQSGALASGAGRTDSARLRFLKRQAIGQAGLIATELPKIWCDDHAMGRASVGGLQEVLKALDAGRGAILLTPHLGAFELSPRVFSQYRPITVLYRPARQKRFRQLMEALRPRANLLTAPADASGVRVLLRALRQGQAIGMLPDQVPAQGEGLWAPFFGQPAYTMVLPIRLAQSTNAPIFWVLTVRTKTGWHLEFEPWNPGFSIRDVSVEQAVAAMNAALEQQIARAPDQYLWAYNRYKVPRGVAPAPETVGR